MILIMIEQQTKELLEDSSPVTLWQTKPKDRRIDRSLRGPDYQGQGGNILRNINTHPIFPKKTHYVMISIIPLRSFSCQ